MRNRWEKDKGERRVNKYIHSVLPEELYPLRIEFIHEGWIKTALILIMKTISAMLVVLLFVQSVYCAPKKINTDFLNLLNSRTNVKSS